MCLIEESCCGNSWQMVIYQTDNKMFYFFAKALKNKHLILPSIIKPLIHGQTFRRVTDLRQLFLTSLFRECSIVQYVFISVNSHSWFHYFCLCYTFSTPFFMLFTNFIVNTLPQYHFYMHNIQYFCFNFP